MKTRKITPKTEIEIKLIETIAYNKSSERFEAHCPDCNAMAEFTTPQIAATLKRSSEREIYRLIERNEIHFVEADRVFVCTTSLAEFGEEKGN